MNDTPRPAIPVNFKARDVGIQNAAPQPIGDTVRPKPLRDKHEPGDTKRRFDNRPLELKQKLSAVLAAADELSRLEGKVFRTALTEIDKLSKPSRRKVLDALQKVYPI